MKRLIFIATSVMKVREWIYFWDGFDWLMKYLFIYFLKSEDWISSNRNNGGLGSGDIRESCGAEECRV